MLAQPRSVIMSNLDTGEWRHSATTPAWLGGWYGPHSIEHAAERRALSHPVTLQTTIGT